MEAFEEGGGFDLGGWDWGEVAGDCGDGGGEWAGAEKGEAASGAGEGDIEYAVAFGTASEGSLAGVEDDDVVEFESFGFVDGQDGKTLGGTVDEVSFVEGAQFVEA